MDGVRRSGREREMALFGNTQLEDDSSVLISLDSMSMQMSRKKEPRRC